MASDRVKMTLKMEQSILLKRMRETPNWTLRDLTHDLPTLRAESLRADPSLRPSGLPKGLREVIKRWRRLELWKKKQASLQR